MSTTRAAGRTISPSRGPRPGRGQLASSTRTAMLLAPDILHVVGYTEAHHAVRSEELIASCTLAHQVTDDALRGVPLPSSDPRVVARSDYLIGEAEGLIEMIGREAPGPLMAIPMRLPGSFGAATSMHRICPESRRLAVRSSPWWAEVATPSICTPDSRFRNCRESPTNTSEAACGQRGLPTGDWRREPIDWSD